MDSVVELPGPILVDLPAVHNGEQIRDVDFPRAARLTVPAGGTGDEIHAPEHLANLGQGLGFLRIEGPEIRHKAGVVLHLLQAAHAGEHHLYALKARGKPNGVAGIAAAPEVIQKLRRLFWKVHQPAALDGLHHQHRLSVLPADLIAFLTLNGRILIIQVVELKLDNFNLGILRQNLVQHLCPVVEGQAHMAHLPLRLQLESGFVGTAGLVLFEGIPVLGVHQIKVKVVNATVLQLLPEQGADVFLLLEIAVGQLVRQQVFFPLMAAGETGADGVFRPAVQIAPGHIKVVKAPFQEGIHHAAGLLIINFGSVHGQAHKAEAQFLFHPVHVYSPFFLTSSRMSFIPSQMSR